MWANRLREHQSHLTIPPLAALLSPPGALRGWCETRTRSGRGYCGRRCCTRRVGGSRDNPYGWWTWRGPGRGCGSAGSGRTAQACHPCLALALSPWKKGVSQGSSLLWWWEPHMVSPTLGPSLWPGQGWKWDGCGAVMEFGSGGGGCWRYWSGL